MKKSRVDTIRKEWAKQQKSGRIPRDPKIEVSAEEGKAVVSRLGFIDGSANYKTGK
jgi:hypothetical protein